MFGSLAVYAQSGLRTKILAARITRGSASDSERVQKINFWIASRIKYDVKGFMHHRLSTWSVRKLLRKRKGLCKEYALLFNELCRQTGISALTVSGYSKGIIADESDVFFTEDHCWNIFKAHGRWYLSDLTWASGSLRIHYSPIYVWQHALKLRKFPLS